MQRLKIPVDSFSNELIPSQMVGRKAVLGNDTTQLILNCYSQKILVEITSNIDNIANNIDSNNANITGAIYSTTKYGSQYNIFGIANAPIDWTVSLDQPLSRITDHYDIALFELSKNNSISTNISRYCTYVAIVAGKGYLFRITSKGIYCKEIECKQGYIVREYIKKMKAEIFKMILSVPVIPLFIFILTKIM